MSEPQKWVINEELCKGCGVCVARCPVKVLAMSERLTSRGFHPATCVDQAKCTSCALCARSCPDVAIGIFK